MSKTEFKKGIVVVPSDFDGADWVQRVRDAGLNTIGLHSGGGKAHNVYEQLGSYGESDFRDRVKAAGLDWEYELHASAHLMDRACFGEHPEYFIEDLRSKRRVQSGNWCVSSSEGLSLVAENALELAQRLPSSTHRYFLWGSDVQSGDWCNCEACAQYSPSEQSLLTSNAMARKLREWDADAQVCSLAYYSTLPAAKLVRPEPNVICEFAPYRRSFDHAICDPRSASNRMHLKYLMELVELYGPERVHILEYWLDASLWGDPKDPPRAPFNRKVCEADIAFYASLGIRNITTFAVRQTGAYLAKYGDRDFLDYAEILSKY